MVMRRRSVPRAKGRGAGHQALGLTITVAVSSLPLPIPPHLQALAMVSNPVVQFAAYEFLSSRLGVRKQRALLAAGGAAQRHAPRLTAGETFAAGAAAKLAATLCTYPMLTLKSRQQMRGAGAGGKGGEVRRPPPLLLAPGAQAQQPPILFNA